MFVCECGTLKKAWINPSKKLFCKSCNTELKPENMQPLTFFTNLVNIPELNEKDISRIRTFLSERRGIFFKSTKINAALNLKDVGSCRKIRKAITILIFKGIPIISTSNGFAMPKNEDQIKLYIKNLENRKNALTHRIEALKNILYKGLKT